MTQVIITPELSGYDVSAFIDNEKVKTTWKCDRQSAYSVARNMADYYTDDNDQPAPIITPWE